MSYDSTYIRYPEKAINRDGQNTRGYSGWREEGMRRDCVMDAEFLFGMINVLEMNSNDGCTTL